MSILTYPKKTEWIGRFKFDHVKCLIVCRGPIRKEALEVFEELGAQPSGILLSEKDSIVYPQTLAPELRMIKDRNRIHHVPDYIGVGREEKIQRIHQIIQICRDYGYTHLFAGYGFMAEDSEFIRMVEKAGLNFVGPNSGVGERAGAKDEAKLLARKLNVSVTPGVDNITTLALLAKADGDPEAYLNGLIEQHGLELTAEEKGLPTELKAERVLQASYSKALEFVTVEDLQKQAAVECEQIWAKSPGKRIRFKYIGGGGGKGQRVIQQPDQVAAAVKEVLMESKANSAGDNKNFLIEMNIEDTRHNEIQLLGNGKWSVALGGRDCSLQMHEQKLLEVSLTTELLEQAAHEYEKQGQLDKAKVMREDMAVLDRMCSEAERFGEAVGLDSASTFECIVEGTNHYFMEVNTRIQVEHRVTEMAYSLKFTNPNDPQDYFILDSLVGAMLFTACYPDELPRPDKIVRNISGCEARINATNPALKPHAGGILRYWSPPVEDEIRDDQGIGILNPDTNMFQPYNLAGAYDSNVALVVSHGKNRLDNFERLGDILRRMEIRGTNLHLNIEFHYGLIYWLIGQDVMVKPNTRFVLSYLAMVGKLKQLANQLNLELAWDLLVASHVDKDAQKCVAAKQTLLVRPIQKLLDKPHLLSGWLAKRLDQRWHVEDSQFSWKRNPLEVLNDLYFYLRLEDRPNVAAIDKIWEDDYNLLNSGLDFYRELQQRLTGDYSDWSKLCALLEQAQTPEGFSTELWQSVRASHAGFQAGMNLLMLPVMIGVQTGFFECKASEDLTIYVPEEFQNPAKIEKYVTELAPPPAAKGNEILSWTGGTFFSKEKPDSEPYVTEGQHFERGDVLGILEVMKMFNPITAEFSGTVKRVMVDGSVGIVVARGQVLFEVEPDIPPVNETEEEILQRQKKATSEILALCKTN